MAHLNVELKARCSEPDGIVQRLLELGAQSQGVDAQTDVYYRAATGRLKLRRGEIENNLIHYDRPDDHAPKESQVSMVAVGSERALDDVLDAALERDVVVHKQRHILWLGNVKFHVDTVAELGSFLEVEAIDYDGDRSRDTLQAQCHEYMHVLGVGTDELEARSYSDMLRTGT
ncbi:class IV adenylate cyclase [Bounagaea algeriensis]